MVKGLRTLYLELAKLAILGYTVHVAPVIPLFIVSNERDY